MTQSNRDDAPDGRSFGAMLFETVDTSEEGPPPERAATPEVGLQGATTGGPPPERAATLASFDAVAERWRQRLTDATPSLPPDEQLLAELAAGETAHLAALDHAARELSWRVIASMDNERRAKAIAEALREVGLTGAVFLGRVRHSLAAAAGLRLNRQLVELQRRPERAK